MSGEGLDPSVPRAEDAFEDAFKVITIGDPDVGKTCLILRYTTDEYRPNLINTVGQRSGCVELWGGCGGRGGAAGMGRGCSGQGRGISIGTFVSVQSLWNY